MQKNRRETIKLLSALGLGAALSPVLAQHQHHHQPPAPPSPAPAGLETIPARAIPWERGSCAFCEMPLATPAPGVWHGRTFSPGFFEQTYAQVSLREAVQGKDALHFESIACMVNYAYVHGQRDGVGSTFYVTDRAAFDPARGPVAVRLLPARQAVYIWAERRGWLVMDSRLVAFRNPEAAAAFARTIPDLGRTRILDWQTLVDLAPLHSMNLVPLLARQAGLLR